MGSPAQRNTSQVPSVRTELAAYSGPLPKPEHFERYEQTLPGAADRILQMAEAQSKHRQSLESLIVNSDIKNSHRGQTLGFILSVTGLGCATYLIATGQQGQQIAGTVLGGTALVSLVSVFVYGSTARRRERENQRKTTDQN